MSQHNKADTQGHAKTMEEMFLEQWLKIRQLTYDYLDVIDKDHLGLRLPFPESQSIGYQFWCMVGAHESYVKKLKTGAWQGFSSSLDKFEDVSPSIIKQQMKKSDEELADFLKTADLQKPLKNGQPAYEVLIQMIKHETHHHGQLINFMYCHYLPIPDSWHGEWALSRD